MLSAATGRVAGQCLRRCVRRATYVRRPTVSVTVGHTAKRGCAQRCAASAELAADRDDGKYFWRIVTPIGLALFLCNMDRICMSVAILPMSETFQWSPKVQGLTQAAFLWGYAATQLLGGRLADKFGGKTVIASAIVFFSLASLALPLSLQLLTAASKTQQLSAAATLACVLFVRFLVGVGEGVVLPSMNSLVAKRVPPALKARALGTIFTGFHCGNLFGLLVSPAIIARFGWEGVFIIFGAVGAPLLLFWQLVMPRAQVKSAGVTKDSKDAANAPSNVGPKEFLMERAVWGIVIVNFVNHWGYFIYLTWIPTYFAKVYGLKLSTSSYLAFLPWIAMAIGSSVTGLVADALTDRFQVREVRRNMQAVAFIGPAVALVLLTLQGMTPGVAVGLFVVALAFSSLGQAGFVANISDVAPSHAGQLFGLCNTFGSLAGIMGVSITGVIYEATGSFNALFYLTTCLYLIAATAYYFMASGDAIF